MHLFCPAVGHAYLQLPGWLARSLAHRRRHRRRFHRRKHPEPDAAPNRLKRFYPVIIAFCAGAFAVFTNIFLKAISELFKSEPAWYATAGFWIYLILIPASATVQLNYLNKGLRGFRAYSFIPHQYAFLILMTTLYGDVFFEEYVMLDAGSTVLFILGVLVACGGILILTYRKDDGAANTAAANLDGGGQSEQTNDVTGLVTADGLAHPGSGRNSPDDMGGGALTSPDGVALQVINKHGDKESSSV